MMFRMFALFLLVAIVAAKETKDEKAKLDYKLDVKKEDKGKLEIKAERKDGKTKEEIHFKLEGEDHGIDCKFEYKFDGTSSKVSSSIRTKIYRIIEFVDSGSDGFDAADVIVQSMNMEDKDLFTLGSGQIAGKSVNGTAEQVDWSSVIYTNASSTFTAKAYYSPERKVVTEGGMDLDISMAAVKLDFIIGNFPYLQNDTKLALEGRIKSKEKVKQDGAKMKTQIDTGDGLIDAGFSWATTVDVDGTSVDLVTSSFAQVADGEKDASTGSDLEFGTYFTINKVGKHSVITWDPFIGLGDSDSSSFMLAPAALMSLLFLF